MSELHHREFEIFGKQTPLRGRCLIEANAGTGKTYNITGMVVRLVAENVLGAGNDLSKILVVTYTKAATLELKDRIVQRLRQCRKALVGGYEGGDNFINTFLTTYRNEAQVIDRLTSALRQIDELSVFTIHGFAQRLLQTYAGQAGFAFDGEIVTDHEEITSELICDYWRRLTTGAEHDLSRRALLKILKDEYQTPDKFNAVYAKYISDSSLSFPTTEDLSEWEAKITAAQQHFEEIKRSLSDKITAKLQDFYSGRYKLNARTFKPEKWPDAEQALDTLKQETFFFEIEEDLWKSAENLGYEAIRQKFNRGCTYEELAIPSETRKWMTRFDKLLSGYETFKQETDNVLASILKDLRDRYFTPLEDREAYTYNDLLYQAESMIRGFPAIRNAVRTTYPISLIDEFQDTDPLQWSIFDKLYEPQVADHTLLYLIGDPKQSIYRFRGADVYAYLHSRKTVEENHSFTLKTNYRSDEGFIRALNRIWNRYNAPFYTEEITYRESEAYFEDRSPLSGQLSPFHWIADDAVEADLGKDEAQERAAHITAQHIRQYLLRDMNKTGSETFLPEDIAVLCNTNKEATLMKEILFEYGLNSVLLNRESIYASVEASELLLVLEAVADPSDMSSLRAALGTRMFAQGPLLLDLQNDNETDSEPQRQWDNWLVRFQDWHEQWKQNGFTPMIRTVLEESEARQHLVAYSNGERRITNLHHLIDLMQAVARDRPQEPYYLLHKLRRRIKEANDFNHKNTVEEYELRLESDRNLIKIVTIHRSKGLKYKVVYTPFLWSGINASRLSKKRPYVFHDSSREQKKIDLKGETYPESRFRFFREELEDNLRRTYVALTRGVHHNILIHVPYKINYADESDAGYAAIDYLLFGKERYDRALHKKFKNFVNSDETQWITYPELKKNIRDLAESSGGTIGFQLWKDTEKAFTDQEKRDKETPISRSLSLQPFRSHCQLNPAWQLSSYSALKQDYAGADDYAENAMEKMDEDTGIITNGEEKSDGSEGVPSLFSFPKGAHTGLCWHKIFELISFHRPDTWEEVIRKELVGHGFSSEKWIDVMKTCVRTTLTMPLTDAQGITLQSLQPYQVRKEMAFHFSFQQADAGALEAMIREPEYQTPSSSPLLPDKGLMKGFIDLIFLHQKKMYILDYKSNYLGSNIEDYGPRALRQSVLESHYDLQYHLYTLAIHRYLKQRIGAEYDYERHFGGVFYLYLRGIRRDSDQNGLYFDHPRKDTILALDNYFNTKKND